MKTPLQFILALCLSCFILMGCEDDLPPSPDPSVPVAFDIADASCLVVLEEDFRKSAAQAQGKGSDNFYKITGNGKFLKVSLLDGDANASTDTTAVITVQKLTRLTDDYIILEGEFSWLDEAGDRVSFSSLLVRESDGGLYDFDDEIDWKTYRNMNYEFREDSLGNIYYFSTAGNDKLMKISIDDEGTITRSQVLADGQEVIFNDYQIDKDGNVLYFNEGGEQRMHFAEGGIAQLALDDHEGFAYYQGSWIGLNGGIFLVREFENFIDEDPRQFGIFELQVHDKAVSFVENGPLFSFEEEYKDYDLVNTLFSHDTWTIRKPESIIFITQNDGTKVLEILNDASIVIQHGDIPIGRPESAAFSDDYFYCAANTTLLKISLEDYSVEELLPDHLYDIYSITLGGNEVLTISALRFSDAKKILFELHPDGSIQIIDETSNVGASTLVRLN